MSKTMNLEIDASKLHSKLQRIAKNAEDKMKKVIIDELGESEWTFSDDPFIVGQVVRLKSGGPLMVVNLIEDRTVFTKWMINGHCVADCFDERCLADAGGKERTAW